MTVATTQYRISYIGDASSVTFAFPYPFLKKEHIEAIRYKGDGSVETLTVVSATGEGNPAGGSITLSAPVGVGWTLLLRRVTPATQEIDYTPNDAFPAETHERGLDKLTMLIQELRGFFDQNAVHFPIYEMGRNAELASSGNRASRVLGFDQNGDLAYYSPNAVSQYSVRRGGGVIPAGQTTLTIPGGYDVGYIDVWMNGVKLWEGSEYTASNGTTIVLSSPAALDAEMQWTAFGAFAATGGSPGRFSLGSQRTVSGPDLEPGGHYTVKASDGKWISVDVAPGVGMPVGSLIYLPGASASLPVGYTILINLFSSSGLYPSSGQIQVNGALFRQWYFSFTPNASPRLAAEFMWDGRAWVCLTPYDDRLDGFLPLSAGSQKALTGDLYHSDTFVLRTLKDDSGDAFVLKTGYGYDGFVVDQIGSAKIYGDLTFGDGYPYGAWLRGVNSIEFKGRSSGANKATLYADSYGIRLYDPVAGALVQFWENDGTSRFYRGVGFYGLSGPTTRPTVNGSRAGNAALASLLTHLNACGIISDASTP